MSERHAEWVELTRCTMLPEAQFIRSLLESEGIDVQIRGEHSVSVQPFLGIMPGGIPVMVPAQDLALARDVLKSADLEAPGSADVDAPGEE